MNLSIPPIPSNSREGVCPIHMYRWRSRATVFCFLLLLNYQAEGSKRVFTVDRTPWRVNGLSLTDTLKVNMSVVISQHILRLRCIRKVSSQKSMSFVALALFSRRKAFVTLRLFEAILCSRRFDPKEMFESSSECRWLLRWWAKT